MGIPRESLHHPEQLRALITWLPRRPSTRNTPDTYVVSESTLDDEVRATLAKVRLVEETETGHREEVGRGVEPHDPPTFAFASPELTGPFVRGTPAATLVSFNAGRSSLALPAPSTFDVRALAHVRLIFSNLPLPLPVTALTARRVHAHAEACDGVMLLTDAAAEWNFDVQLPTAQEAASKLGGRPRLCAHAVPRWARCGGATAEA